MTAYHYKIRQNGTSRMGTLEAASLQEASTRLRREGGVVLQLRAETAGADKPASAGSGATSGDGMRPALSLPLLANRVLILRSQVELTLRQLGSLLSAGVPILTALRAVDVTLLKVAEYSEEQLSRRVGILSTLVEPAIFVVVGGMVGFVYFGFFLAMLAATRSAV